MLEKNAEKRDVPEMKGGKRRKIRYQRWWALAIAIMVALSAFGCGASPESAEPAIDAGSQQEELPTPVEQPYQPEEKSGVTVSQRNALGSARSYLNLTAFSYSGLISQLEYEKYSTEDATYAADNCGANWNEQAALSAQSYLAMTSFSRQGLIDQLLYEGFTQEQAEYGVTQNGF